MRNVTIEVAAANEDYRLAVFGPGTLHRAGTRVRVRSRRTLAVAWYVGSTRSGVSRADLAELFWPAAPLRVRRGNLRVVLSTLHSAAPGLLETAGDRVRRGPARLVADVDDFELGCRVAVTAADTDERLAAATRAADLLAADLFTGADRVDSADFRSWVDSERRRLQLRFVDAVGVLGEALLGTPRSAEALEIARMAAGFDEYNASVHRLIASGLAAVGDTPGARRHLAVARAALTEDLGLPDESDGEIPWKSVISSSAITSMFEQLDPLPPRERLFGRDELMSRLSVGLSSRWRQVTLIGAGGVGKTALAIEVAHRARESGRDAVFVDLVGVEDIVIARRLVVERLSNRPFDEPAAQRSAGPGPLVVLDNFEHVLQAAPGISELFDRWPSIAVMVTSRVPLRIPGERVIVVPRLAHATVDATSPASEMFVERSRRRGVEPDALDPREVSKLCRLLDGLPLSIELAAAQCAALGLPAVLDLVRGAIDSQDLGALHAVDPSVAERHSSLDAVIDETLSYLDTSALDVLAAASVFEGAFTIDALIAVASRLLGRAAIRIAFTQVVEASLVRTTVDKSSAAVVWYRLPPPVRAVAGRLLGERWDPERVVSARVEYDVAVARAARDALAAPDPAPTHRMLERYLPSMRSTLDLLVKVGDPRRVELVASVVPYRWATGNVAACASWMRRAEIGDEPSDDDDVALWATAALWKEATDAELLGLPGTAAGIDELVDRVLRLVTILDRMPGTSGAGAAVIAAIHTLDAAGRSLDALSVVETARRIAASSPSQLAAVDYREAKLLHGLGDDVAADALLRRVVAGADRHRNRRCALEAGLLVDLVGVAGSRGGRRETLAELLDEAMAIGDRRQVIWTLVSLGAVDVLDGRLPDAVGWFRQALGVSRPFAYALGLGSCLLGGAAIALLSGDVDVAQVFDGSLDGELPALNRALPHAYVDAYRVVHQDLADRRRDDRALAGAWSRGRTLPRSRVIEQLDRYLTGRADGSARPVTDASGVAALRAVSRGGA